MISILIPTYNYEIVELVKILQNQCTKQSIAFEIIVVDDCSSKKGVKTKNKEIANLKFCRYIENKENMGRTASRDYLAKQATYQWLLFLDADVLPKNNSFIKKYNEKIEQANLVFGGIIYTEIKPADNKMLRWKYGHARESLTVEERNKKPYISINSGCFLIKKDVFISINKDLNYNKYGLDNLFKQLLKERKVSVLHIDNPVYHLGLEKNEVFIKKALKAVETTVYFENKNFMDPERPIQKVYLKVKKYGMLPLFRTVIRLFKRYLLINFTSKNPSLFLFDLYRLYYYDKLKRNA